MTRDPDAEYAKLVQDGVAWAAWGGLPHASVSGSSPARSRFRVEHCQSAWQSAFNRPDIVDELLAAELATGWIEEDPGGDEELRSRVVKLTAVGKLGVVISDHRPPRARWLTVPFPA